MENYSSEFEYDEKEQETRLNMRRDLFESDLENAIKNYLEGDK